MILNFWLSFLAGLSAPLFAVCVLPLYPGFLAYLSSKIKGKGKDSKKTIVNLALMTIAGVITSMAIIGLVFTFILKQSLTNAIEIVSPIAFIILAIISILMIFNVDVGKVFPKVNAPITKNSYFTSFIFGFFFGLIVLPCNPAALVVLFALSTTTVEVFTNMINFILFGLGMGLPLLIIGIIGSKSQGFINYLSKNKKNINLIAGIIMLLISLYYLIFVFGLASIIT
jgi:cytochrome c-type biogenesis protein